ncbi:MAG: chaperone modulator CbpM [Haliea sp.]|uniref:chaperone modulator CbpM n=1 Tax=Haliea sp. TaxID=1932666 RepID=UPI0032EF3BD4
MNDIALRISLGEVCECEQVSRQWLVTMVEHDIVIPVSVAGEVEDWMFDTRSVPWMKRAIRLHRDLELDWVAIAMILELQQQREELLVENRCLQQRLQRFLVEG